VALLLEGLDCPVRRITDCKRREKSGEAIPSTEKLL
jgi:hypothetical protein